MSLDDVKRLRTQFLDVIDGAIANLENGVEVGTSTKNSTDVIKHIAKKKRTTYNEFNTLAMRWAYSNNTNIGDTNIFNRNGREYVLIEATEDGYIELASGNYESVRYEYERIYAKTINENLRNTEEYRSSKGTDIWDNVNVGHRRNGNGISGENSREKFQSHTTGNDEFIRSNSKKTQGIVKKSLDVDTDGNILTKAQQEYFKESKVRDENGRLKVMYHGTPNATYNAFRAGTYFTENEEYADTYQYPGASSISVKSTAENPDTYAVYLDIKKPFDTRNQKERDIFNKEFYLKWGNGSPLQESGLPDWVEGMDLLEFLEEKGYDYDGLILDEGGEGGYGMPVYDRGLAYITFNAKQIKNVDNLNPTDSEDIRYSKDVDFEEQDESFDRNVIDSFGIAKINDYRHVQIQVFNTLVNEGFFDENASRIVTNANSGMKVEINESGIEEAFDPKNYGNHGKRLKILKLASIRHVPDIIENGTLTFDNEKNYHNDNSNVKYAYIEGQTILNGKPVAIRITVRKSLQKNKFWVHNIYTNEKNTTDLSAGESFSKTDYLTDSDDGMLTQDLSNVKFSKDVENYDMESLIKQNEKLQKTVEYYKMMMGRNSGHKVNRRKIRQYAVELKKEYNSAMSTDDITASLTELFDFISSGDATWDTVEQMNLLKYLQIPKE